MAPFDTVIAPPLDERLSANEARSSVPEETVRSPLTIDWLRASTTAPEALLTTTFRNVVLAVPPSVCVPVPLNVIVTARDDMFAPTLSVQLPATLTFDPTPASKSGSAFITTS